MPRTQIATRGLATMGLASAMVLISLGGITPAGASPPQGQSKSVNVHFGSLQQEESYTLRIIHLQRPLRLLSIVVSGPTIRTILKGPGVLFISPICNAILMYME
jgi:hypothetical protein